MTPDRAAERAASSLTSRCFLAFALCDNAGCRGRRVLCGVVGCLLALGAALLTGTWLGCCGLGLRYPGWSCRGCAVMILESCSAVGGFVVLFRFLVAARGIYPDLVFASSSYSGTLSFKFPQTAQAIYFANVHHCQARFIAGDICACAEWKQNLVNMFVYGATLDQQIVCENHRLALERRLENKY
ncbi:uncharacterized protein K452DRAFT_100599 [Aplosporella prunicola CBS 121167]|uniref:Uncharacterized protein n=1 Tax=Aplosporella prunicola CBS 121167 TaxID=1176127 RepID=A0A6A6B1G8_9PEZI|nr:uncharacterized protein K452DRAFT_100599 [Aplosporella prunicola CBS 121167]KAF2137666.1 hypothetical protein K452DRAFT_100599 [Aplosporella prunicola CBS 121167]